ncbi:MAG: dTDP-4-dehydrorhamnose reductase [Deltaproteobacteria bacterium]|nr:dTDP-4-dehydrorhamnose reductase [Deltaproteobacteria bacterium]
MKVLVTGAGGQLGRDLQPRLESAGLEGAYLDSTTMDITDREVVFKTITEKRPDVIINCAAYTKVDQAESEPESAFKVNGDGPAILADSAAHVGALMVHISTDFVFDGAKSSPYKEDDAPNPLSVYGKSKLAGEEEITKRLTEYIIVRTAWAYGVHGNNFVKTILRKAGEQEALKVVSDQVGTPTWTGDIADALVKVAMGYREGSTQPGIYHFTDDGVASWHEFASAIIQEAEALGISLKCRVVEPIPTSEYPLPAERPAYSVLDTERIKKSFGLSIPHWRVSLRRMIKEYYGGDNA